MTAKIYRCLFITIFCLSGLFGNDKPTVCLNMIVKNETDVIKRCLGSLKHLIDYWVIVDTGSSDGTQEMITEYMKDIPGELHERVWKDFAFNRNEALNLAKNRADYILIIDADEVLSTDKNFKWPQLDQDFYFIETQFAGTKYSRVQLVKSALPWKWEGVLHEAIVCPQATRCLRLEGIFNIVSTDGSRSKDPQKYHKDAKILENALLNDPENTRYLFYLAQSYSDAGEGELAIQAYENRIAKGGWDEEVFWSKLKRALNKESQGYPKDEVVASYKDAYSFRESRVEPLYHLAKYYRLKDNFAEGYDTAKKGLIHSLSADLLFVDRWIYDYGLLLEYSINAYWTGHYEEALLASKLILGQKDLPTNIQECVEKNMLWIYRKIKGV